MTTKLTLLSLLLFVSCGKELSSSSAGQLESFSQITSPDSKVVYSHGKLTKIGEGSAKIVANGSTFSVDPKSSKMCLDIIAKLSTGSTVGVKYAGTVVGSVISVTDITEE